MISDEDLKEMQERAKRLEHFDAGEIGDEVDDDRAVDVVRMTEDIPKLLEELAQLRALVPFVREFTSWGDTKEWNERASRARALLIELNAL